MSPIGGIKKKKCKFGGHFLVQFIFLWKHRTVMLHKLGSKYSECDVSILRQGYSLHYRMYTLPRDWSLYVEKYYTAAAAGLSFWRPMLGECCNKHTPPRGCSPYWQKYTAVRCCCLYPTRHISNMHCVTALRWGLSKSLQPHPNIIELNWTELNCLSFCVCYS